ncbi:MAG: hypothetical protein EBT64_07875 [Gammaproteobacteria bacterium]|nr:hypothetical protein [Gammaproteobacteria bacterium]
MPIPIQIAQTLEPTFLNPSEFSGFIRDAWEDARATIEKAVQDYRERTATRDYILELPEDLRESTLRESCAMVEESLHSGTTDFITSLAAHAIWMINGRKVFQLEKKVAEQLRDMEPILAEMQPIRSVPCLRFEFPMETRDLVRETVGFGPGRTGRVLGAYLFSGSSRAESRHIDVRIVRGSEDDFAKHLAVVEMVALTEPGGASEELPFVSFVSYEKLMGAPWGYDGTLRDRMRMYWNAWHAIHDERIGRILPGRSGFADTRSASKGSPRCIRKLTLGSPPTHVTRNVMAPPVPLTESLQPDPPTRESVPLGAPCWRHVPEHNMRFWVKEPRAGEEVLEVRDFGKGPRYCVWRTRNPFEYGDVSVPRKTQEVLTRVVFGS